MKIFLYDKANLGYLLTLWCVVIAVVNPVGDFPLNDDWAYAHNTYALALENRWYFSDWPAMTLVAHTVWGALFCKIFGASFTVLRFSTLLLGAAGLWGFYRLLRWSEMSPNRAFMGVLLLMFNPLWFVSSFSYMTEVPFLAVMLWAVLFSLKAVETRRADHLLAAVGFTLWACMIRQLGLLLPMVFAVLFLYHNRWTLRHLFFSVLPFGVCFASVSAFEGWLRKTDQTPEAYTSFKSLVDAIHFNHELLKTVGERSGIILLTLGIFLLPLFSATPIRTLFQKPGRALFQQIGLWTVGLLVLVAIGMGWSGFPTGNVFYNLGLGAIVLKDVPVDDPVLFHLSGFWLVLLKLAAALSAISLFLLAWKNGLGQQNRAGLAKLLALGFVGAYWAFSCFNWLLIDRYILPLVPFLVLLVAPSDALQKNQDQYKDVTNVVSPTKFGGVFEGKTVLIALMALFSILCTHDYLAWNRARYAGLDHLTAQGVQPEQIDGGFEFNGYHRAGPIGRRQNWEKSWWFVGDDEWVVSMHVIYGYDLVQAVPYHRWFPPGMDSIWVNRRKPSFVQDSVYCGMETMTTDSADYIPEAGNLRPGNARTRSDDRALSGQYSARTHKGHPFAMTTVLDTFRPYEHFLIQVWRYPAKSVPGIVLAADDGDKFWAMETDFSPRPDSAGWRLLEIQATIPQKAVGQKGKLFLWNASDRDTVWFDDLKVLRWRARGK